jgi:hypothetical protein
MTDRFIVDDAGTLIDIETRNTYDYVDEICPILNELDSENKQIKNTINEMYNNERTYIGKSTLKQLLEQIQ